jgi:hypothetical protein
VLSQVLRDIKFQDLYEQGLTLAQTHPGKTALVATVVYSAFRLAKNYVSPLLILSFELCWFKKMRAVER